MSTITIGIIVFICAVVCIVLLICYGLRGLSAREFSSPPCPPAWKR